MDMAAQMDFAADATDHHVVRDFQLISWIF